MSLINDALKKAESMQPAAAPASAPAPTAPVPPAASLPPPGGTGAPLAAPSTAATSGTTPPALRLSLANPASAGSAMPTTPPPIPPGVSSTVAAPVPAPMRLSLSSTPVSAPTASGTTSLRLNPTAPAFNPGAAPQSPGPASQLNAPVPTPPPAPIQPALPPTVTTPSLPAPASATPPPATPPEEDSLESLRLQYKKAGTDDILATEKAIATAALEPAGLKFRLAAPETMAQAESGSAVATPPIPTSAAPGTPPGSINPLTGLRTPTPELAAAFLASNPAPAGATAPTGETSPAGGALTPPPVPDRIRNAPPPKGARKKSANPESILLVVGGILAVLLGGGLTGAYLYLRNDPKPPAAPLVAEGNAVEPGVPTENLPEGSATTPPVAAPGMDSVASPASSSGTDSSTATTPPAENVGSPSEEPKAPVVDPGPPPPPPPRINRPDPTILAWVQKIQLTGIRAGPPPKVFMNGKLYEVGELVNFELNLKLTGVVGKVLHFEDAEGNTYEYRF